MRKSKCIYYYIHRFATLHSVPCTWRTILLYILILILAQRIVVSFLWLGGVRHVGGRRHVDWRLLAERAERHPAHGEAGDGLLWPSTVEKPLVDANLVEPVHIYGGQSAAHADVVTRAMGHSKFGQRRDTRSSQRGQC